MSRSVKRSLKIGVGVAVTVFLFWLVLKDQDPREILAAMAEGDPLLLLAAVAIATFGFLIRAMRWHVLLIPVIDDSPLRDRFAAVSIHFMANNLIPLRVGEVARAYVFSQMQPVKASATFGSVVVERFLDGLILLVLLVIPVFMPGFPEVDALEGTGRILFQGAVTTVLLVLVALIVMATMPTFFMRIANVGARLLPERSREPILGALESFLDSLAVLRDPKLMFMGIAWTVFFWMYHAVSFWLGMEAFGIETGYWSAVFVSSVVAFIVAVPGVPGYFGSFHFAITLALVDVYGVAAEPALAYAFAYHFGGLLPITLIGLYYASKLGLSLGEVGGGSGEDDAAGPDPSDGAQERL